jgi:hypothetical protein
VQEVQDKLVANRDDFVGVHVIAPAQEAQRAREWLLNQCPDHWHTLHARGVKIHAVFNRSLRTLMDRFGTASEAELITTELLYDFLLAQPHGSSLITHQISRFASPPLFSQLLVSLASAIGTTAATPQTTV